MSAPSRRQPSLHFHPSHEIIGVTMPDQQLIRGAHQEYPRRLFLLFLLSLNFHLQQLLVPDHDGLSDGECSAQESYLVAE